MAVMEGVEVGYTHRAASYVYCTRNGYAGMQGRAWFDVIYGTLQRKWQCGFVLHHSYSPAP
jgi:hypothetical protein